jgi:heme/copper-type cytochrome/quinol oxidase subunit 1
MSAVEAPPVMGAVSTSDAGRLDGIGAWIITTDHRRIGRMTIVASSLWLIVAATLAAVLGAERVASSSTFLPEDAVAQMFVLMQTLATFGVVLPLLFGVAVAVVPSHVGSRTIALARVALLGFYAWLVGVSLMIVGILANGGPAGGNAQMVDLFMIGLGTTIVGLLATAVTLFATVAASRRPGLALADASLLSWSSLVGAVAVLVSMPVLLGTVIYVAVDHQYDSLAFGGAKSIMSWIGWGFGQPQTFVYAIIAVGLLAEMTPLMAGRRQPLRGAMLAGVGLVAATVVGTVTQTTQQFVWGGTFFDKIDSFVPYALYNLLPVLGVSVVILLALLAVKGGKPKFFVPFVPVFLGVGMIFTGMVGNAIQLIDVAGLEGTVFAEGVTIYVVYGAVLAAWGAVALYGPNWTSRSMTSSVVLGIAALGFVATVLAGLPLYIAGFAGQPAASVGEFTHAGPKELLNAVSAIGHGLMVVTVVGGALAALKSFCTGPRTSSEWGGDR